MLKKLGDALRGALDRMMGGYERRHPEALLELAKQDFRERMAALQTSLGRSAGACARLREEIAVAEGEARRLGDQIAEDAAGGRAEAAGEGALALAEVEARAAEQRTRLAAGEAEHQKTLAEAVQAQADFKDRVAELERRLEALKLRETVASVTTAADDLAAPSGDVAETLRRVETVLAERSTAAEEALRTAAARSALPVAVPAPAAAEGSAAAERRAQAARALAEFLKKRGIAVAAPPPARPAAPGGDAKTIGPIA